MSISSTLTTRSVAPLFEPIAFGAATCRNRVVMAPMTRSRSPGHVPNDRVVEYYRRRAAGGVGLLVSEGTTVDHPAANGYPDVPAFHGADALAGWKRVVEAVHGEGALMIPQLWHVGSVRQKGMQPDPAVPGYAPSPVVHPFLAERGGQPPVEMTQADIDDVVGAFASAAASAKDLGFDGVELHGAHAYLIDQFFWDVTNRRGDGYGGDLIARTRFACEIVAAVRAATDPGFPIVLRFSQWKMGDYRAKHAETPRQLEQFLAPLVDAGVDVFHCSTRRFWDPELEGSPLNLAGWTKKLTGKPTMTVGSVGLDSDFLRSYAGKEARPAGLDELLERLEAGEFDYVAVGRALLADAEWANKLRAGHEAEIVPFTPEHMQRFE